MLPTSLKSPLKIDQKTVRRKQDGDETQPGGLSESYNFTVFVPLLMTLCVLGLKV